MPDQNDETRQILEDLRGLMARLKALEIELRKSLEDLARLTRVFPTPREDLEKI